MCIVLLPYPYVWQWHVACNERTTSLICSAHQPQYSAAYDLNTRPHARDTKTHEKLMKPMKPMLNETSLQVQEKQTAEL